MTGVCHIVCAGPCADLDLVPGPSDFVIAVDGGFAHCIAAGVEPRLFVGDLDSLDASLVESIACERIELPRAKDDTDTFYACKEGLARGYRSFELHAALGGDLGHELANIQTLAFLESAGSHGVLRGCGQALYLVTPTLSPQTFEAPVGTRVSVFAFEGLALGVDERGLRWELDGADLSATLPIGVSNENVSKRFEIGVREGALLVVIG